MNSESHCYVEYDATTKASVLAELNGETNDSLMRELSSCKLRVSRRVYEDDIVTLLSAMAEQPHYYTHLALTRCLHSNTPELTALLELIRANTGLTHIRLKLVAADTAAFKAVAVALKENTRLSSLKFANSPPVDYAEVFEAFWNMRASTASGLIKLYLSRDPNEANVATEVTADRLYAKAGQSSITNVLTLSKIYFTREVDAALLALLRTHTILNEIRFVECTLTTHTYEAVAKGLMRCHNIDEITVDGDCDIRVRCQRKTNAFFCQLVKQNRRISSLPRWNLYGNPDPAHNDHTNITRAIVCSRFYH